MICMCIYIYKTKNIRDIVGCHEILIPYYVGSQRSQENGWTSSTLFGCHVITIDFQPLSLSRCAICIPHVTYSLPCRSDVGDQWRPWLELKPSKHVARCKELRCFGALLRDVALWAAAGDQQSTFTAPKQAVHSRVANIHRVAGWSSPKAWICLDLRVDQSVHT